MRPIGLLGVVVVVLIAVAVVAYLARIVVAFADDGLHIAALAANTFAAPFDFVSGAIFVAVGVAWIVWQMRAASNADRFSPESVATKPAHALLWLVPVVNIVFSLRSLLDIWRRSVADDSGPVFGWWLTFWFPPIVSATILLVGVISDASLDFAPLFVILGLLAQGALVAHVASGVLAIMLVRHISRAQDTIRATAIAEIRSGSTPDRRHYDRAFPSGAEPVT